MRDQTTRDKRGNHRRQTDKDIRAGAGTRTKKYSFPNRGGGGRLPRLSSPACFGGAKKGKYQKWEERLGELEALVSRFVLCVPVAYADAKEVLAPDPEDVFAQAARTGKSLVLVDTCRKDFGGLFEIIEETVIRRWCRCVQAAGMQIAIAGKLTLADIHRAAELGPDVVAVRSGVCVGGRLGRVSAHLVAAAKSLCGNERVSIH